MVICLLKPLAKIVTVHKDKGAFWYAHWVGVGVGWETLDIAAGESAGPCYTHKETDFFFNFSSCPRLYYNLRYFFSLVFLFVVQFEKFLLTNLWTRWFFPWPWKAPKAPIRKEGSSITQRKKGICHEATSGLSNDHKELWVWDRPSERAHMRQEGRALVLSP